MSEKKKKRSLDDIARNVDEKTVKSILKAEEKKTLEERARDLNRSYLDHLADSVRLDTRAANMAPLATSSVRCPLCHERFEKMADTSKLLLKPIMVLVCHRCKVGIRADDPYINAWEPPGAKPIDCPRCEGAMRFFATSTGYWRAECWNTIVMTNKGRRKCGATLSLAQPDRALGTHVLGGKGEIIPTPIPTDSAQEPGEKPS